VLNLREVYLGEPEEIVQLTRSVFCLPGFVGVGDSN
jgi:hypothetical protein